MKNVVLLICPYALLMINSVVVYYSEISEYIAYASLSCRVLLFLLNIASLIQTLNG